MGRNRTNYNNKYNANKDDQIFYDNFSEEDSNKEIDLDVNEENLEETLEETNKDVEPYEEPIENAKTVVLGKVNIPDNKTLNVRSEASTESDPLTTINSHSEVVILDSNNEKWYKICTAAGVEGYVLKEYITGIHNTII